MSFSVSGTLPSAASGVFAKMLESIFHVNATRSVHLDPFENRGRSVLIWKKKVRSGTKAQIWKNRHLRWESFPTEEKVALPIAIVLSSLHATSGIDDWLRWVGCEMTMETRLKCFSFDVAGLTCVACLSQCSTIKLWSCSTEFITLHNGCNPAVLLYCSF